MYSGSPFEMKFWHPEQKLGDCLVSMLVCFILLFCSYFLASDSFRTTFRSSSSVRYFFSYTCDSTDERRNGSQEQRLREVVNVKTTSGTRFGKARSFSLDNVAY